MKTSGNLLELSLDKIVNEIDYSFLITMDESVLSFSVSKPLDSTYWQGVVDYSIYQKENCFLMRMKEETFFMFIKKGLQTDQFKMTLTDTSLIFEFYLEIGLGDFVEKYPLYISLDKKTKDLADNLSMIASHLKKLENQFDKFKNKIEVEIKDCEENTKKGVTEAIGEFKRIHESYLDKINNDFNSLFERNRSLVQSQVLIPKWNDPNLPSNIKFSNENKTIEKINQTSWVGVKFLPILEKKGIFEFSVSLDNVSPNSHVMVGYCLNSHNASAGCYSSNCLAMLYLNSGYVYSPLGNHVHNKIKGHNGLIFTSVIDIDSKIIYFKLNGYVITLPVQIKLEEADKENICPCIDMYEIGDRVSLK